MPGRTPAEAVHAFVEPLQRALSCVTDAVLQVDGGYYTTDRPHALTVGGGSAVPIGGQPPLSLRIVQHYRIVEATGRRGPWKVRTAGYLYSLEDSEEREVLAYHWHPEGRGQVTSPHLHLGAAADVRFPRLADSHLPTGRVSVEEVVRLAIEEFEVPPARDDWERLLDEAQSAYETWRTWPAPSGE